MVQDDQSKQTIIDAESRESTDKNSDFANRVLGELKQSGDMYGSKRDRLPPAWQVIGAIALLIALSSIVVALGNPETDWHQRFLTGFMDGVLMFIGELGEGLSKFLDHSFPNNGKHWLTGITIGITVINIGFFLASGSRHLQRHRRRSSS